MSHFDNSGSEDGQLRSPTGDDYYSEENQIETADSLDIKPPQHQTRVSSGRRKSGKEKKHSREHRHKDRERFRDYMIRERQNDRSGGGGGGSSGMDERRHRHFIRDNDRRNQRRDYYERNEQQQQQEYHSRHKRGRDKHIEQRDIREKDRRKAIEHQYESKVDAERALEDLRTRLLSKRHKYQKEIDRYDEQSDGHYENISRTSNLERTERSEMIERDRNQYKKDREHRERKDQIIEVIDSPEHFSDYSSNLKRKERERDKKKISNTSEDLELAARKAKLLEAEREMSRRKEVAREELEARREKKRERNEIEMTSSPPSGKMKSKRHREANDQESRKRHRKSPQEEGEFEEKEILELSDNSDESTDDDESETESESDSNSHTSDKSEGDDIDKRRHRKSPNNDEDDDPPLNSPLSIGNLSKSERRRQSKSRSRSQSIVSQHSECSKSANSRFLSKSPRSVSRSQSRDRSLTKSRSRSETKSRSRSRSRSHSRSRSRSRSISAHNRRKQNDEDDDDEDINDDIEIKNLDKSKDKSGKKNEKGQKSPTSRDNDDSPVDENGKKLPNYYPAIQGCRSVEEFQCLNRIEEGTYGVVYRAKDKRTNEIVALKRLKMEKEKEGFPITSLREINTLLKGQHPNIVTVREIVVGSNMDKIFIVMDYVEHDLKSLMETMKHKEQSFFPGEVKCLTQQLLRAVAHLHDNWILHRDLKTSNLLLSHKGILKVGDFGLAREYGSPLKQYTSLVVTLWYRAPELLLCSKEYSTPIDMWSVGCIFAEFLQMGPLFPGKSEIDQLNRIFKELGTPNEKIWPGYKELPAVQNLLSQNSHFTEYPVSNLRKRFLNKTTELGVNLLQGLLTYDPKQRLTAEQALKSPYFKELPLPIDPSMFPTWPAKSELGIRRALASSPKPPSGGSQFKQLGRDDNQITGTGSLSKTNNSKTGFVLNANIEQRQVAMAPGFNLKF